MGWWKTEQGADIIGDGPADTITSTLRRIASKHEKKGKRKPTLQHLLTAIEKCLSLKPRDLIFEGEISCSSRLVAKVGTKIISTSSRLFKVDELIIAELCDGFEEIAQEYEESELERKPYLSELLANVAFVLSYRPEEYLSGVEGISVDEITIESTKK